MRRDMHYRTKSLKELIDAYAFEVGRKNLQNREATQKTIVNEVYARIKDTDPDAVDQMYRQLIEH